jgi:GMP synthase-like glutamine amidotransferase
MKPISIFRFSPTEGPGYFATFLDQQSIPWRLFKVDAGDAVPQTLDDYAAFVFMGGPMSVNDDLPWIPPILKLIQAAIHRDQPCLGHCLGGQLISKALGGVVSKNHVKEIGWQPVRVEDNDTARTWLPNVPQQWTTFQWHGETFTIPPGAERILTGTACANQAYVIGNSLGMQCHVEMTPAMIESWCRDWTEESADPDLPSIQRPEQMLAAMDGNLRTLNDVADTLYSKWIKGISR